jgi:hypothetical protein
MVGEAELESVVVVMANYETLFAEWYGKDLRQEKICNKGFQADISTPEFSGTKHGPYLTDGDTLFLELNPVLWGMWLSTRQTNGISGRNRLYVLHTTHPFRWSRVNDRLCRMQTGAVFTANLHVSAAVTCWLTRSFHDQNTRGSGWRSRVYLGAVWTAKLSFIAASFFIDVLRFY